MGEYHADRAAVKARLTASVRAIAGFALLDLVFIAGTVYFAVRGDVRPTLVGATFVFTAIVGLLFIQFRGRRRRLEAALSRDAYVAVDEHRLRIPGRDLGWEDVHSLLIVDARGQIGAGIGPVKSGRSAARRSGASTVALLVSSGRETLSTDIDNVLSSADTDRFLTELHAHATAAGVSVEHGTSMGDSVSWGLRAGAAQASEE
jgi:hypothetical protein